MKNTIFSLLTLTVFFATASSFASIRIDCGKVEENKGRSADKVISFTSETDLSNPADQAVKGDPKNGVERSWSVYVGKYLYGDAISAQPIRFPHGEVDGYALETRARDNKNGNYREIRFTGLFSCLNSQGYAPEATATITKVYADGRRDVKFAAKGCKCELETAVPAGE